MTRSARLFPNRLRRATAVAVLSVSTLCAAIAVPGQSSAAPQSSPSGVAIPIGNRPGWRHIFADDFTTNVPLGQFPTAVTNKWTAYRTGWRDSTGNGMYAPDRVVSVAGGILDQNIRTENGTPLVAALIPKVPGSSEYGMTYGRYTVRFRSDAMPGYKIAWMLWPDSGEKYVDGEIDFPEVNLDSSTMWGFVHRADSIDPSDKAWFRASTQLTEWHTTTIEWSPNLIVFELDGVEVGRTSERVPARDMHWVLQAESEMVTGQPPSADVNGHLQIDWVSAWAYDPSTADTTAPTIAITTPSSGSTVVGTAVGVNATATDSVGVEGVQFYLDGVALGAEDTTAPYATTWNTTLGTEGAHALTAVARDDAGNSRTATANVVVANPVDVTPPSVVSTTPITNGTAFPQTASVFAYFSEAVTGVSSSTMAVKEAATGTLVPSTVVYKLSTTTASAQLIPSVSFKADTRYTVTLASSIRDAAGNSLPAKSWDFITGPRPVVTVAPSAGGSIAASSNPTATFSEAVQGVSSTTFVLKTAAGVVVPAAVTYDASTRTATLNPANDLVAGASYTTNVSTGIKDLSGNSVVTTSTTFTTEAVGSPTTTTTVAPTTTTVAPTTTTVAPTTTTIAPTTTTIAPTTTTAAPTTTTTVGPRPAVRLANLAEGDTVRGSVLLGADIRSDIAATQIKWYVDKVEVISTQGPELERAWESSTVSDGQHRIFVKVRDAAGTWYASPSILVQVSNA